MVCAIYNCLLSMRTLQRRLNKIMLCVKSIFVHFIVKIGHLTKHLKTCAVSMFTFDTEI